MISIHAPREGGDYNDALIRYTDYISIHAPREGGDQLAKCRWLTALLFQSTPPARGATIDGYS